MPVPSLSALVLLLAVGTIATASAQQQKPQLDAILTKGIESGLFPGAVAIVGRQSVKHAWVACFFLFW
jgi:hypothetical protein